jgi:hypothetical protein
VVALYDHGGHGQFAAPVARDVLKAYFDKKARLAAEGAKGRGGEGATTIGQLLRFGLPRFPAPAQPETKSPIIEAAYFSSDDNEAGIAPSPARTLPRSLPPTP